MSRLSSAFAALSAFWGRLSPRERLMVGGLGVVLAGMLVWLAVLSLQGWRDDAVRRSRTAAADHMLVLAAIARDAQAGGARIPAGGLEAVARETAEARGLALPAATAEADGAVGFNLESVASNALFGWLATLEGRGARVAGFSAVQNPDTTLQARVTLQESP